MIRTLSLKFFQQRGFTEQRSTISNIWKRVEVKAYASLLKRAALTPSDAMVDELYRILCLELLPLFGVLAS